MINVAGAGQSPDAVLERLRRDSSGTIKAVLIDHNETSTCVLNDVGVLDSGCGRWVTPPSSSWMRDFLAMPPEILDEVESRTTLSPVPKGFMLPRGWPSSV
jgi:hypothetical protein